MVYYSGAIYMHDDQIWQSSKFLIKISQISYPIYRIVLVASKQTKFFIMGKHSRNVCGWFLNHIVASKWIYLSAFLIHHLILDNSLTSPSVRPSTRPRTFFTYIQTLDKLCTITSSQSKDANIILVIQSLLKVHGPMYLNGVVGFCLIFVFCFVCIVFN